MAEERILSTIDGAIATITLNRREKLNAITPQMLVMLERTVLEIEQRTDIRVVIITGAGERAFSAGADIAVWSELEPVEMWRRWVRDGHRVFNAIARLRQPTIAALNGHALGGGLELALAADLRIAAEGIELGSPEVRIGTVPGWGGTRRLARAVDVARAKQLILTGSRISAARAETWGLVNEVVPRPDVMTRAMEIAEEIAANAPVAVQIAKSLLDGDDSGLTLEALAGALAAMTSDGAEGIAAFREKRAPRFTGR